MTDLGECPFCRQPLTTGYVHEVVVTRPPQWALDAIDGAALHRLREALPGDVTITLQFFAEGDVHVVAHVDEQPDGIGASIAEAVDMAMGNLRAEN